MYGRILVGYLDTEQGHDALELGRVLTQASGGEMLIVTASDEDGRDLAELARSEGAPTYDLGWRPLSSAAEGVGMRVVGVGFDGSRAAYEALDIAAELAVANGAALRVYTVARKYAHPPAADASGHVAGVPTEAEARALPVFLRGNPAVELIGATEMGVDMLVLGSRRGGPVRRALHSSVSSAVIQEAHCPVLLSPAGVKAPTEVLV